MQPKLYTTERAARRELRAAGILTDTLLADDLRVYVDAKTRNLLAWHWDADPLAILTPAEVRDEAARGPNAGVLAEIAQTGAKAVRRERVRFRLGGSVVRLLVVDWEAPDAFDGLGWSNRTVEAV